MKIKLFLTAFFIICTSIIVHAQTYIRNIEIVRQNVFDNQLDEHNHFIYKLANKLHVVTRENVIRRELLFNEGEIFNREKLDQSLRNIRALPFIGEADAILVDTDSDSVDIKITTEDLWTTVGGIASEGGGGLYSVTIYAEEKNVAGLGIGIDTEATFASDNNDGFSVGLFDPRLFSSRNGLSLYYSDYEFENSMDFLLYRPFYSVDTRYGFSANISRDRLIPRLFYRGEEVFRYKKDFNYFGINFVRTFGRYTRLEPQIRYIYSENNYSEYPGLTDIGVIPDDEIFSGPGIGFRILTHRYKTARYLDEFGTTEDITEHASVAASLTWSGPTFRGDYITTLASIEAGFFYQPINCIYVGFKNSYSSYYQADLIRERITNITQSIVYFKPVEYQLLALRTISQFAWRQKPDYQLTLGGDNGLRGYPDRYLTGTRLFLTNLEYRFFTPVKILTAGLGAAAFFDAGYVWRNSQNTDFNDLKTNIGIGLRIGLTKSSTARTIRLDLARALNEDNWYISFGTENLFSLARFQ